MHAASCWLQLDGARLAGTQASLRGLQDLLPPTCKGHGSRSTGMHRSATERHLVAIDLSHLVGRVLGVCVDEVHVHLTLLGCEGLGGHHPHGACEGLADPCCSLQWHVHRNNAFNAGNDPELRNAYGTACSRGLDQWPVARTRTNASMCKLLCCILGRHVQWQCKVHDNARCKWGQLRTPTALMLVPVHATFDEYQQAGRAKVHTSAVGHHRPPRYGTARHGITRHLPPPTCASCCMGCSIKSYATATRSVARGRLPANHRRQLDTNVKLPGLVVSGVGAGGVKMIVEVSGCKRAHGESVVGEAVVCSGLAAGLRMRRRVWGRICGCVKETSRVPAR